jgi:hypothetical protein
VYGLVLNDPLIYVVNIFGLLTGIVQYILLIMYWPGRTKKGVTVPWDRACAAGMLGLGNREHSIWGGFPRRFLVLFAQPLFWVLV